MMGYVYLLLAIVLELVGTMCMKQSDGFSTIPYALGTLVSYGFCFYFLSLLEDHPPEHRLRDMGRAWHRSRDRRFIPYFP